jgi:hippurate hydrolase
VAAVERIVTTECAGSRCPEEPEITVTTRSTPTVNDARAVAIAQRAHRDAFGDARVARCPPTMATEDFAEYGADGTIPLVYWLIGATGATQWSGTPGSAVEKLEALPTNHSSRFAPAPAPTLRTGTAALALAALACLREDRGTGFGESGMPG